MSILALVVLYFGFHILKGSDIFSRTYKYYVIYDNIDGLTTSNPVLLNGLTVGRVQSIKLLQEHQNNLLVTLDIQKGITLNGGTIALLADGGLLGGKEIHLSIGKSANILSEKDTLIGSKEAGISALLQEKALPVVTHADSLVRNLNVVVEGFKETGLILNQVMRNYDATGTNLNSLLGENRKNLVGITANLNKLTSSLLETEKQLQPLLAKTNTIADSLNALRIGATLQSANKAIAELQQILAGVKSGNGTAGKLITDETLYHNLNLTMVSLNKLMTNLREEPKRYVHISVFGKKDRGPSESPLDSTTVIEK